MTKVTDNYVSLLNDALDLSSSPMGAYCIGVVSGLAWQEDRQPTRDLMYHASSCDTVAEAIDAYEKWKELAE